LQVSLDLGFERILPLTIATCRQHGVMNRGGADPVMAREANTGMEQSRSLSAASRDRSLMKVMRYSNFMESADGC
jgi:hypothetical protein